jgi:hypothetical protein
VFIAADIQKLNYLIKAGIYSALRDQLLLRPAFPLFDDLIITLGGLTAQLGAGTGTPVESIAIDVAFVRGFGNGDVACDLVLIQVGIGEGKGLGVKADLSIV